MIRKISYGNTAKYIRDKNRWVLENIKNQGISITIW